MKTTKQKDKLDPRILKVAKKIRQMRIDSGYSSYEQFAWDNNLNRVQYWRIEKGANITLSSLLKVLDVHKVSLKKFFEDL